MAIIGMGHTKFGKHKDKNVVELFGEAAIEAMDEAGVDKKDIEALFAGFYFPAGDGIMNIAPSLATEIGLENVPSSRFEGACASATVAFRDAYIWVASGMYDMVIVGGAERALIKGTEFSTRTFNMSTDRYESDAGLTFPGVFAMSTILYSRMYDLPLDELRENMAYISMQNHKHGALNPHAQFYGKMGNLTLDKVLESAVVCYPLTLLDCCPFTDGGAAAVICSADIARKYTDEPIYILGTGQASGGALGRQEDFTKPVPRVKSARMAFKQAGLSPNDIQYAEVHDCFTIAQIILMEAIGFYEWGEGYKACKEGDFEIGGKIPTNMSGGLLGKGHPLGATGISQIYGVVEQMKGKAPKGNQIDPLPEIGMTDNLGGDFGTLAHIILGRSRRSK
ncbi:MAG: acetyl-CoA C-acyltransferase [Candidatus Syntrophoarchaeum caldarius]|uniref:Acetyl-CoA C-acyltransferase n=2 Tax=Candidatus Syntropharchaeum caldarium TaxID=1838285 RepID=A0A1F2P9U3_9EURY|nr:MAG: acetyl-CoA C-acyltransferase [Candidatus Syntrophoarchaeum caldarius]